MQAADPIVAGGGTAGLAAATRAAEVRGLVLAAVFGPRAAEAALAVEVGGSR